MSVESNGKSADGALTVSKMHHGLQAGHLEAALKTTGVGQAAKVSTLTATNGTWL